MYKTKNGTTIYETFDELLTADIRVVWEYDDYYYMKPKSEYYYDNSMCKVNKKTHEVSYVSFTGSFEILNKATSVDEKEFKKMFQKGVS